MRWEHLYPLPQLYHAQFYQQEISFCPSFGSKSSRYEPNADRRAVNKVPPALIQITARLCVRFDNPAANQDQQKLLQIQLLVKKKKEVTIKNSVFLRKKNLTRKLTVSWNRFLGFLSNLANVSCKVMRILWYKSELIILF